MARANGGREAANHDGWHENGERLRSEVTFRGVLALSEALVVSATM